MHAMRPGTLTAMPGQDLLGNPGVLAHIARLSEPSLQFDRLFILGPNDADGQLARPAVIRPVEGDGGYREASKSFLGLLGQPLACLLPEHAVPRGVFWTQDAAMRPPVLGRVRRTIRAWSAQGCDRHSSPAASARCSAQRRPGAGGEPPLHCGKSGLTRPAP